MAYWNDNWKKKWNLVIVLLVYLFVNILVGSLIGLRKYLNVYGAEGFYRFQEEFISFDGWLSLYLGSENPLWDQIHQQLFTTNLQIPLIIVVALISLYVWLKQKWKWGFFSSEEASGYGSHGSARWATKQEIKQYYTNDPDGFLLGLASFYGKKKRVIHPINGRLNQNIMTFGAPGSGKTSGYVIPNILYTAEQLGHSMVITDPKGELVRP